MLDPHDEQAEYSGQVIKGLDLAGQEVAGRMFLACTFIRCSFAGAVLQGCRFAGCTFRQCDLSLVHEFVRSIVEERAPAIDAVTAANWTAAGICAHQSAMQGGAEVEVPRFDE